MNPENLKKPENSEAVGSPQSDDLESTLPVTPVKTSKSGRVPGSKRKRKFARQVEIARKAIIAGTIEPKARPVAEVSGCAYRTSLSILQTLTDQQVIVRDGRGWRLPDKAA